MKTLCTYIQKATVSTRILVTNHINHIPLNGWIVLEIDYSDLGTVEINGPYESEVDARLYADDLARQIDELANDIDDDETTDMIASLGDDLPF